MTITHVIFDMDGVIVDSESIYTRVFNQLVSTWGHTYSYQTKRKMMGMKMETGMKYLVEEMKLPISPEELLTSYKNIFKEEIWNNIELLPGMDHFIRSLHKNQVPIAIATGSNSQNYENKTKNYKYLISLFHHIVLGDDSEVKNGKPDPEVYRIAQRRFDEPELKPENCLVFEDAINGCLSGCRAGMKVVWIPDLREPDGLPYELKEYSNQIERLKTIKDFNPVKYGLPSL